MKPYAPFPARTIKNGMHNINTKTNIKRMEEKLNLEELFYGFTVFALKTFKGATAQTSLEKLKDEIIELENADTQSNMAEEYVDCFMCLLDRAARTGVSIEELKDAFHAKLEKNKLRKWKQNYNGTYSHVK
jgi:hypothetical protein